MTIALIVLLAFVVSALVAACAGTLIAAGKDAQRRDARERHLILCLTVRDAEPAQVRALRLLDRPAPAAHVPPSGDAGLDREIRDMLEGRDRRQTFVDPVTGEPAVPAGMD